MKCEIICLSSHTLELMKKRRKINQRARFSEHMKETPCFIHSLPLWTNLQLFKFAIKSSPTLNKSILAALLLFKLVIKLDIL